MNGDLAAGFAADVRDDVHVRAEGIGERQRVILHPRRAPEVPEDDHLHPRGLLARGRGYGARVRWRAGVGRAGARGSPPRGHSHRPEHGRAQI